MTNSQWNCLLVKVLQSSEKTFKGYFLSLFLSLSLSLNLLLSKFVIYLFLSLCQSQFLIYLFLSLCQSQFLIYLFLSLCQSQFLIYFFLSLCEYLSFSFAFSLVPFISLSLTTLSLLSSYLWRMLKQPVIILNVLPLSVPFCNCWFNDVNIGP